MDLSKILYHTVGGGVGVNIIQFHSISVSFGSVYFFLFQSLDVRASESLSAS